MEEKFNEDNSKELNCQEPSFNTFCFGKEYKHKDLECLDNLDENLEGGEDVTLLSQCLDIAFQAKEFFVMENCLGARWDDNSGTIFYEFDREEFDDMTTWEYVQEQRNLKCQSAMDAKKQFTLQAQMTGAEKALCKRLIKCNWEDLGIADDLPVDWDAAENPKEFYDNLPTMCGDVDGLQDAVEKCEGGTPAPPPTSPPLGNKDDQCDSLMPECPDGLKGFFHGYDVTLTYKDTSSGHSAYEKLAKVSSFQVGINPISSYGD